jgi:gamma-glutamylcyclotransferase (GGCT)/AIG2-like uncharacterized protein YtfP
MSTRVFFYGTLRTGFSRRPRTGVDPKLKFLGHGSIQAALFDVGLYPAAVPATDSQVFGEVFEMIDPDEVLAALDDIEGYRPNEPDLSLYTRVEAPVTFEDGRVEPAWVYFYNAPLGRAARILSGDYLDYLRVK